MVFFLMTTLLSAVVIFLAASLLEWILRKVAPGLGPVPTTVAAVVLATAAYLYVMTRPAVVGPYEQFTFENIGGQVIGGVLVAGLKLWTGRKTVEQQA